MNLVVKIENGKPKYTPAQDKQRSSYFSKHEGKEIIISHEIFSFERSLIQNRYLWALYNKISSYTGYLTWEVHLYCKENILPKVVQVMEKNIFGQIVKRMVIKNRQLELSTAPLSRGEFSEYCQKIREFASEELGVYLMTPDQFMETLKG